MSQNEVTRDGLEHTAPGREATVGVNTGAGEDVARPRKGRRGGEQPMVPEAQFSSYYDKAIINSPVWEAPDIPGYLFLGGLAGASSVLAAGAQLTSRPALARAAKLAATGAVSLSFAALVHDLGRPARFANMLRTFKPTSPMSVGSWLLSAYAPAAMVASLSAATGRARRLGNLATAGAAAVGPLVATYTAALITNTAVPSWHDGYREMPFVFAASAMSAAAGVGLIAAPSEEVAPLRRLGAASGAAEVALTKVMEKRMGLVGEAYELGKARRYGRLALGLTSLGAAGAALCGHRRWLAQLSGAALVAGSALERFAIFESGFVSAEDPKYTVVPQRMRRAARTAG
ncbi:MAG: polysulfide reductase NrfD [Actinomycetota bacterium]|nr:polysulfide reductase NrfD [Actinomycetota bacterium]